MKISKAIDLLESGADLTPSDRIEIINLIKQQTDEIEELEEANRDLEDSLDYADQFARSLDDENYDLRNQLDNA